MDELSESAALALTSSFSTPTSPIAQVLAEAEATQIGTPIVDVETANPTQNPTQAPTLPPTSSSAVFVGAFFSLSSFAFALALCL